MICRSVWKTRISEQLVCVFSVDKIITDHLPHICICIFFFFNERTWSNFSASADKRYCSNWSIWTNPDQCWTKAVTIDDYSSLFGTIRFCSPLFALFETIRTIRTFRYSLFATICYSLFATIRYSRLFAIRYSGFPDTPAEVWYEDMQWRHELSIHC